MEKKIREMVKEAVKGRDEVKRDVNYFFLKKEISKTAALPPS